MSDNAYYDGYGSRGPKEGRRRGGLRLLDALLTLCSLAVGAVIIGFAGPILNPDNRAPGTGPLLIVVGEVAAQAHAVAEVAEGSRRIA